MAVFAQLYTASLTGVVTDPSGGVIPNAKVTVTDADKGFTYTGTTDYPRGRLLMRNLPPGKYSIDVQAPGFKPYQRSGITLEVNQNATSRYPDGDRTHRATRSRSSPPTRRLSPPRMPSRGRCWNARQ